MLPLLMPRRARRLIRGLKQKGFSLEKTDASGRPLPKGAILLRSSLGLETLIFRERGVWEVWAGAPEVGHKPVIIWKAYVEDLEGRNGIQGIEWQCDYLESHLEDIERAVAVSERARTKECLKKKTEEANRRISRPTPIAAWYLDVEPRSGVHVHFGLHWEEDSYIISPAIVIDNQSGTDFRVSPRDFGVSLNGSRRPMYGGSHDMYDVVGPRSRWERSNGRWHWLNVWPVDTIGLSYVSSDPASRDFTASRVWKV